MCRYVFQNCFSGVTIILIGCAGSVTTLKAQGFLLLSLVVAIVNLVNLVILEVGEWRGFLTSEDRNFIKDNQLDGLMYSAYLCTTISTVIAMITSFLASQHAFCFQQILAEKEVTGGGAVTVAGVVGGGGGGVVGNLKNNQNSLHRHQGPLGNIVHHNFDHGEHDDDSLMPKVCGYQSYSLDLLELFTQTYLHYFYSFFDPSQAVQGYTT